MGRVQDNAWACAGWHSSLQYFSALSGATSYLFLPMSLLTPTLRDRHDAHGDLDEDQRYHALVASKNGFLWRFEPVSGLFLQSDSTTDDMAFNYALCDFGRVQNWEETIGTVTLLNAAAPKNVRYKLLFLARHGEGFHNIASLKYSKEEWFSKWRHLGTDGDMTWGPDAKLTDLGVLQAEENNRVWHQQLALGAPVPGQFYVSPLLRSARTLVETWKDIEIPQPVVKESLRETMGVHLCHKRSTKKEIAAQFPQFAFESGFSEEDALFEAHTPGREQLYEQFLRINGFMQGLFEEEELVVSITSHAGTIRAFLTVIGHRKFTIPTGGMIPVVVRGEKAEAKE